MRKALARALIVASALSGFAFASPVGAHEPHHANGEGQRANHCKWNPHTHKQKFFNKRSQQIAEAEARGQDQRAQRLRENRERHEHHAHQCHGDRGNYPPF